MLGFFAMHRLHITAKHSPIYFFCTCADVMQKFFAFVKDSAAFCNAVYIFCDLSIFDQMSKAHLLALTNVKLCQNIF